MTAQRETRGKFIARLSEAERERLNTLIQNGTHGARQLLKARVLLKADAPTFARLGQKAHLRWRG